MTLRGPDPGRGIGGWYIAFVSYTQVRGGCLLCTGTIYNKKKIIYKKKKSLGFPIGHRL